jgi:hypothetical protein
MVRKMPSKRLGKQASANIDVSPMAKITGVDGTGCVSVCGGCGWPKYAPNDSGYHPCQNCIAGSNFVARPMVNLGRRIR